MHSVWSAAQLCPFFVDSLDDLIVAENGILQFPPAIVLESVLLDLLKLALYLGALMPNACIFRISIFSF